MQTKAKEEMSEMKTNPTMLLLWGIWELTHLW
jgi:hypothetical protein